MKLDIIRVSLQWFHLERSGEKIKSLINFKVNTSIEKGILKQLSGIKKI